MRPPGGRPQRWGAAGPAEVLLQIPVGPVDCLPSSVLRTGLAKAGSDMGSTGDWHSRIKKEDVCRDGTGEAHGGTEGQQKRPPWASHFLSLSLGLLVCEPGLCHTLCGDFLKAPPGRGLEGRQVGQEKRAGRSPKGRQESWAGLKVGTEEAEVSVAKRCLLRDLLESKPSGVHSSSEELG